MKKTDARDKRDFRYEPKNRAGEQQCCRNCAYFDDCVDCKGSDPACESFENVR